MPHSMDVTCIGIILVTICVNGMEMPRWGFIVMPIQVTRGLFSGIATVTAPTLIVPMVWFTRLNEMFGLTQSSTSFLK